MSKGNLQTQQRLLGFVHGLGGKLKKRPLVLSQRGVMSNTLLDYNLVMLVQKGLLIREPDGWVVPEAKTKQRVDRVKVNQRAHILGSVSTDKPAPALDTEEAGASQEFYTVEVPAELTKRFGRLFALKVKGTGMIDALIDNGDVVIIRPATHVNNGEMVIAWFKDEEESILRKFYAEGDQVRLQPANSTMDPIYSAKGNIEVRGKIVYVVRVQAS